MQCGLALNILGHVVGIYPRFFYFFCKNSNPNRYTSTYVGLQTSFSICFRKVMFMDGVSLQGLSVTQGGMRWWEHSCVSVCQRVNERETTWQICGSAARRKNGVSQWKLALHFSGEPTVFDLITSCVSQLPSCCLLFVTKSLESFPTDWALQNQQQFYSVV